MVDRNKGFPPHNWVLCLWTHLDFGTIYIFWVASPLIHSAMDLSLIFVVVVCQTPFNYSFFKSVLSVGIWMQSHLQDSGGYCPVQTSETWSWWPLYYLMPLPWCYCATWYYCATWCHSLPVLSPHTHTYLHIPTHMHSRPDKTRQDHQSGRKQTACVLIPQWQTTSTHPTHSPPLNVAYCLCYQQSIVISDGG